MMWAMERSPTGPRETLMARRGFTLIEILMVVVIIGILAALAIPKFSRSKSMTYSASIKQDLRTLSVAQEDYFLEKNI